MLQSRLLLATAVLLLFWLPIMADDAVGQEDLPMDRPLVVADDEAPTARDVSFWANVGPVIGGAGAGLHVGASLLTGEHLWSGRWVYTEPILSGDALTEVGVLWPCCFRFVRLCLY